MLYDIAYNTAVIEAGHELGHRFTKYTPYIAHLGELCNVCCDDFEEMIPYYSDTALYTS